MSQSTTEVRTRLPVTHSHENDSEIEYTFEETSEVRVLSERKVKSLRQLSNVIQALENLFVQCDGVPRFAELQALAGRELSRARLALKIELHR